MFADDVILTCEQCDQLVCTRCFPDGISQCAAEPIYHCALCAGSCPACQQDLMDAMGVDHDR